MFCLRLEFFLRVQKLGVEFGKSFSDFKDFIFFVSQCVLELIDLQVGFRFLLAVEIAAQLQERVHLALLLEVLFFLLLKVGVEFIEVRGEAFHFFLGAVEFLVQLGQSGSRFILILDFSLIAQLVSGLVILIEIYEG